MTDPDPEWQRVTTRQQARALQGFTCTTEFPRTPGGRRLPHDRPWEWEAQRHLRQASQLLRPGDLILAGVQTDEVVAAAHLQFDASSDLLQVFIAAAGIALTERCKGGGLADRMLAAIRAEGLARAADSGCTHLVLTGKIHTSNTASQQMVQRAGWEPHDAPSSAYQSWGLIVPV
jgi:acetyltransferase (GNAT) family protein